MVLTQSHHFLRSSKHPIQALSKEYTQINAWKCICSNITLSQVVFVEYLEKFLIREDNLRNLLHFKESAIL